MIKVDESDPIGDIEPKFPYRDVTIKRGVDAKNFYELITEIGRGKFGTVYKCREKETGVELAAKFIAIPKREDKRNVEREIHMMNTLRHAKILQLYDAYEYCKMMCVVVELVEGGELFDRVLDDTFLLTEKACSIFVRQICEAMDYIHQNKIIHLDLKPENILCLTREGNRIKIIDFGLAREYDPDKKLQVLFGTPEFVAPEVVNFDSIGAYTDMWSVGVIAYVLVSGLSPFAGETDIETMANVTIGKYDFEDDAFQQVSTDAMDFITRLLRKDPNDRMTASEAIGHRWVRRKPQYYPTRNPVAQPIKSKESLDTTKENLKNSIDRWNDNTKSQYRYLFDQEQNLISPVRTNSVTPSKGNSLSPPSLSPLSGTPTPDFLKSSDEFDKTLDDYITSSNNNFHYSDNTSSSSPISPINHCFSETRHVDNAPETEEIPVKLENGLENGMENEPTSELESTEESVSEENVENEVPNDEQIDQEIVEVEKINGRKSVELTNGHDEDINGRDAEENVDLKTEDDSEEPQLVKEKPVVPDKPMHLLKQSSNGPLSEEPPKINGHAKPEIRQKPDFLKNYKPSIYDSMNRAFKMSTSHFSSSIETTSDSLIRRADFQTSKKYSQSLQENGQTTFHHGFSDKMNECIEATSNMFRDVLASHQNGHDLDEDETTTSSAGSVPWPITNRRTKFRVNQMSRDVPFGSPRHFAESEHLSNTKGCLLQILERFNDPSITRDQSQFSKNIEKNLTAMNWDTDRTRMQEDMTVETMNSINAFFHQHANGGKTVKQMREQLETKSKF